MEEEEEPKDNTIPIADKLTVPPEASQLLLILSIVTVEYCMFYHYITCNKPRTKGCVIVLSKHHSYMQGVVRQEAKKASCHRLVLYPNMKGQTQAIYTEEYRVLYMFSHEPLTKSG